MSWQQNGSSQLSNFRRTIFYQPTGTGRDSYIMVDNGGTSQPHKLQGVANHGNFMKFGHSISPVKPSSGNHAQKYHADGTGRDNYITTKWNSQGTMNQKVKEFRQTFRDWSSGSKGWRSTSVNPERQEELMKNLSIPKRKEEKWEVRLEGLRNVAK